MALVQLATSNQVFWVDDNTGEPVEVAPGPNGTVEELMQQDDESSKERVWGAFYATPEGAEFRTKFLDVPGNGQRLAAIFNALYPDDRTTVSRLADAYRTGRDAGEFQPKPMPAQTAPRARDDAGRFADRQSQLRAEIRALLADPNTPASYFRQRAATDREFGDAWRAETAVAAPAAETSIVAANADEILFAQAYRRTPSLRPNGGIVVLDYADGQHRMFSVKDFQIFVDRCIDLKLL